MSKVQVSQLSIWRSAVDHLQRALIAIPMLAFVACGVGSVPTAIHTTSSTVSGYAVDGPIKEATVTVFAFKDGVRGEVLGTSQTNSRGYYEVQLKRKDALPVLLEVKSGYYEEDVSDLSTTVTLKKGEILTAVGYYQHTTPLTLHVTPYTHIATGLTEYWVSENIPVVEAIHRANAAVSRMLGDIDITTTPPLRTGVVDGPGGMKHAASMTMDVPANYLYGLFTGALSVYAKEINSLSNATASRYTSIGLAQRMYEDIKSDGVLDGKIIIEGVTQQLKYGAEKLNSTRYRQLIGQGALSLANTHSNDNDIPFEAVMHKAHYFAESRDPLFGAGTPFPFDTDPPVIGAFVRTAYDKIKGDVSYYVDAQDPVGVRGIKVSVDKVLVTDSVARSGVTLDLNLHDVLPGEHSVTVEAMDILGNIASKAFTIIMPDGKPVAEITSPLLSNKTQYLAQGDYIDDGGAGIASIVLTVNGVPTSATIDAATGRWQAPLTLADGQNSLFIRITDKQGASREITRTVSIDTQPPEMRVSASISETELYQNGQVVLGKLSNAIVNGDPLYIPRKRISFADPTVPSGDLDNAKIPYFTVINLSGEEVEVSLQYRVNGEVRTALHPLRPTFADKNIYIIPLIGEVLAEEWYQTEPSDTQFLDVQIKDKAGNAQMQSVSFHAFFDLPVIRVRSNVRDAMVHAHEFTLGAAGGEVGHCMTDAQGECSMRVLVEPGLLHFTLMSGGYNEPASGVVASLKDMQSLSSVVDYNGANIDIAITPYTHLGMGLIQHAIDSGSGSVRAAYSKALEDVAALYGYDVFATIPNNPALPVVAGSVLSKESRYALLLAGLSAWTAQLNTQNGFAPHTVHTSVSAAQVFYQDALADGKLNGIGGMMHGDTQVLTLNGEAIDANTYRMTLASQMLNYATERNLFKGGNKDALWAYAQGVAENTHTIFAGAAPVGTDATWTVIKLLSERATKLANYPAKVRIASATATVSRVTIANTVASLDANGDWVAPIALPLQGRNNLEVRVFDANAIEIAHQGFDVVWDNLAPTLTITTPASLANQQSNLAGYKVSGTAVDVGGLASVVVSNGTQRVDVTAAAWTAQMNLLTGDNLIVVDATDILGNTIRQQFHVNYFVAGPKVVFEPFATRIRTTRPQFRGSVDPFGLSYTMGANLYRQQGASWSLLATKALVANAQSAWTLDFFANSNIAALVDGNYKISITATNSMNNSAIAEAVFAVDNLGPNVRMLAPIFSTRDNPYTLVMESIDNGGTTAGLTVDGVAATPLANNQWSYVAPSVASDGVTNYAVEARDDLGNVSQNNFAIRLDRGGPSLTFTPPLPPLWVNTASTPLKFSMDDISLPLTSVVRVEGVVVVPDATGNIALQKDGANTIEVTASDGLGNTTARSIVVNRDRQAPIISTTPASLPLYTNATSQSFAASATDALSAPTISVGLNTVAQATSVANGLTANWSGTSLVLSEGTNVITVDAVDLAGNKASQTKFSVVRDTVLPTLSMSSSFNSNGSSSYSVTGTVTELNPDIVTLTKTNTSQSGTKFTKTYVGGSKWSVTVTGLVSGSNTFSVVARDKAGNVSTTKSITVTR